MPQWDVINTKSLVCSDKSNTLILAAMCIVILHVMRLPGGAKHSFCIRIQMPGISERKFNPQQGGWIEVGRGERESMGEGETVHCLAHIF